MPQYARSSGALYIVGAGEGALPDGGEWMFRREYKGSRRLFPIRLNAVTIGLVVAIILVLAVPAISRTAQSTDMQGMAAMAASADVAPIDTSALAHTTTVQSAVLAL